MYFFHWFSSNHQISTLLPLCCVWIPWQSVQDVSVIHLPANCRLKISPLFLLFRHSNTVTIWRRSTRHSSPTNALIGCLFSPPPTGDLDLFYKINNTRFDQLQSNYKQTFRVARRWQNLNVLFPPRFLFILCSNQRYICFCCCRRFFELDEFFFNLSRYSPVVDSSSRLWKSCLWNQQTRQKGIIDRLWTLNNKRHTDTHICEKWPIRILLDFIVIVPYSLPAPRDLWAKFSSRNFYDAVQVSKHFTFWWDPKRVMTSAHVWKNSSVLR